MRDIPRYFAEEIAEMRAGLKRGFTPPKVTIEGPRPFHHRRRQAKPEDIAVLHALQDDAGDGAGGRTGKAARRSASP